MVSGSMGILKVKKFVVVESRSRVKEGDNSDLFHPKTSTFSTHALIWVHFKTVHYFSQQIFSLFSYLKMHYKI